MMLYRKVVLSSQDYNFAMHTFRALVTNFFPGDYDYEAPIQTLRHRLYITLHALDRRFTGNRDANYSSFGALGVDPTTGGCSCFIGVGLLLCMVLSSKLTAGIGG